MKAKEVSTKAGGRQNGKKQFFATEHLCTQYSHNTKLPNVTQKNTTSSQQTTSKYKSAHSSQLAQVIRLKSTMPKTTLNICTSTISASNIHV